MFQAAYVLTASAQDTYAAMTLVSALSLKITNPTVPVTLLCDHESADYIRTACRHLLDTVDALQVVDTPPGDATFRNRWIKTRLGLILPGDVLFLDSDILVRGSLAAIAEQVKQFGAVHNHNGATVAEQIWDEDRDNLRNIGWSDQFDHYLNGGVWMYRTCDRVKTFFQTWHDTWLQSVQSTGRLRDQPSFNRAIADTGLNLTVMPRRYNEQLAFQWDHSSNATIWHFYASHPLDRNSFNLLIRAAETDSLRSLRVKVARAIRSAAPWPNIDPVAVRISHRKQLRSVETMWLEGRRRHALLWLLLTPFRRIRAMMPKSDAT